MTGAGGAGAGREGEGLMGDTGGFAMAWARAIAASEAVFRRKRPPLTDTQVATLARLFNEARAVRGYDWLPDERETAALVGAARVVAR